MNFIIPFMFKNAVWSLIVVDTSSFLPSPPNLETSDFYLVGSTFCSNCRVQRQVLVFAIDLDDAPCHSADPLPDRRWSFLVDESLGDDEYWTWQSPLPQTPSLVDFLPRTRPSLALGQPRWSSWACAMYFYACGSWHVWQDWKHCFDIFGFGSFPGWSWAILEPDWRCY